ncbi:MAG TPA: translation initiation factor IF-2 [Candidatus Paceibacterota bacterium]
MTHKEKNKTTERPPVIVIMGHVDHGKSTLLDYIRKTNIAEKEAGGITQHTYSYEITHKDDSGKERKITFLDTPGHEAFSLMRERGAHVADIAILVVAGDDGVKKQTIEALNVIRAKNLPFVVAVTKTDKEATNIERVKQDLAEHEVYVEGYGGDVPCVGVSSKTGAGTNELLDLMLLVADLKEFTGDPTQEASGFVIESGRDPKKGIGAVLLVKDGTLEQGSFVATPGSFSPIRRIEDFLGATISKASFSSPIRIAGWNTVPVVGSPFKTFSTKKEAEAYAQSTSEKKTSEGHDESLHEGATGEGDVTVMPVIIKADMVGTLEAIEGKIRQIKRADVHVKILDKSVGSIGETDVKRASGDKRGIIIGFNVSVEQTARDMADRLGILIKTFDIIYKLTEWFDEELEKRRPRVLTEETTGTAKIIKVFGSQKNKFIIGGKVTTGTLSAGKSIKIIRRNHEIGVGKITGLEQEKKKVSQVLEGKEFGAMVELKYEPAPGDIIQMFEVIEK